MENIKSNINAFLFERVKWLIIIINIIPIISASLIYTYFAEKKEILPADYFHMFTRFFIASVISLALLLVFKSNELLLLLFTFCGKFLLFDFLWLLK